MSRDRVGVVSGSELTADIEAAGGTPVAGHVDDPGDVEFVVAGESALVDFARAGVDVPVLPVGAGPGVRSVPRADAETAIERVLGAGARTERHPILSVSDGTGRSRALFDVALMAAEPARISEFSVRYGDERVARFRADGVVASTPAGSPEYNRSAGGPVLAPDVDALSVVPVAPFATDADQWVLSVEDVTLSVERDETPVELLADGRTVRSIVPGEPVSLTHADDLRCYVVPESREFF